MKSVSIPSTAWNTAFMMVHFQYTLKTFKLSPLLFAWKYIKQRAAKRVSDIQGQNTRGLLGRDKDDAATCDITSCTVSKPTVCKLQFQNSSEK